MSCSLQLPPSDFHAASFSTLDSRDTLHHSPTLSASPLPHSPASTVVSSATSGVLSDGQSPLSLASPAPVAPEPEVSAPVSRGERVRSLIHGYSTALIASAVREKAWSDLQRLDEIFSSPAEQAHLSKQQKWKLALRQQRLRLYLQHEQLDHHAPLLADGAAHSADAEQPQQSEDSGAREQQSAGASASAAVSAPSASSSSSSCASLTIFTTPPLPPAQPTSSLARELSSFSLYTPEAQSTNGGRFTFAVPLRSPSAPAEAAYSVPVFDSALLPASASESPSTPSSSSSASSRSPGSRSHRLSLGAAAEVGRASDAADAGPVSRSGRRIKRKFDLTGLSGGARRPKKVSVGSEGEARSRSSRARPTRGPSERPWERHHGHASADDADDADERAAAAGREAEEDEEEEEEEGEEDEDVNVFGVAYRH